MGTGVSQKIVESPKDRPKTGNEKNDRTGNWEIAGAVVLLIRIVGHFVEK